MRPGSCSPPSPGLRRRALGSVLASTRVARWALGVSVDEGVVPGFLPALLVTETERVRAGEFSGWGPVGTVGSLLTVDLLVAALTHGRLPLQPPRRSRAHHGPPGHGSRPAGAAHRRPDRVTGRVHQFGRDPGDRV
ncbi:hypothetical protein [Streptomyces sp. NPDC094049]|uniref:hypothetical protein n=1 Tax=Streptomyces sp. NPDC094049 TaxID=3154987 RepID=UPI0033177D96